MLGIGFDLVFKKQCTVLTYWFRRLVSVSTMPLHLISQYIGPHGGAWEVHWFPRNSIAEDYAKEESRKARCLKRPSSNATLNAQTSIRGKVQAMGKGKKAKSQ